MALFLFVALSSVFQTADSRDQSTNPVPGATIESWFRAILISDDEARSAQALAEFKQSYDKHGLPTTGEVGDKAAYIFVLLLSSQSLPLDFRSHVLTKIDEAAARNEIPVDAAVYYAARLRVEAVKAEAEKHSPSNPALRDEIQRMYERDQAVRQQQGFDREKLEETDREHAAPLQAILSKYGVPTYSTVGPLAAGEFVVMIQHQPARFRQQVLPKLKANVDAAQADPESYAMVYDRSQRDEGKKQLYGEQFECEAGSKLHIAPVEDEPHLNQRRAQLGLMRIELYEQLLIDTIPQFFPGSSATK